MARLASLAAAAVLAVAPRCTVAQSTSIAMNFSALGQPFEGIGALSGGGGVTR